MQEPFFEMNNNNSWSVKSYPPDVKGWEQQAEGFRSPEVETDTKQIQNESGDFYQDTTPFSQDNANNPQRMRTYAAIQEREQTNKGRSFSIPLHSVPSMNHDHDSSPTLGIDYSQMSINQGRGSFTDFQNCRSSTQPSMTQVSFSSNTSTIDDYFSNDNTSTSANYKDLSTLTKSSPNTYESINSESAVAHDGTGSSWCSDGSDSHMDNINNLASETSGSYASSYFHDGLPRLQDGQQDNFADLWNDTYEPTNNWPPNPLTPNTVKPKALNLNASFASNESIDSATTMSSSQTSAYSSSESTPIASSPEDTSSPSLAKEQSMVDQSSQPRPRHMLPSFRPTKNNEAALELSHDRVIPGKPNEPRMVTERRVKHQRTRASTPVLSAVTNTRSHTIIKNDVDIKDSTEPTTPQNDMVDDISPPAISNTLPRNRSEQNEFLVNSRQAGMSYKTIRSKGKFTDAESTLRGRFRTLTKDKKDRVRKPEWTDNDLRLLRHAVKRLGRKSDGWARKVPWKEVAEYIADNGGSYRFGYATCRKRWDELEGVD
ncbi:hypothetical protein NHQ30_005180 [Ciborinia camelliae]|nr:hypothetical protein NHQ30_005180 [Ciborinia camelliae]